MMVGDKVKELKITEETPKLLKNRALRRLEQKNINHNIFTKKYKSDRQRQAALKIFLGIENYKQLIVAESKAKKILRKKNENVKSDKK